MAINTMRDLLNTKEGYREIIEKYQTFIQEDIEELQSIKVNKQNIRELTYTNQSIFKYSSSILSAKYSSNERVDILKDLFESYFDFFLNFWDKNWGYTNILEMLSLSILLCIDEKKFKELTKLIDKEGLKDFVIDFLISSRYPDRPITDKILWKKPYQGIYEVVEASKESKDAALQRLEKYLKKEWYKHYDGKDTHKSEWNIHTGYWSFESGAIAKVLQLEDSSLKKQQYYPYDMVHFHE